MEAAVAFWASALLGTVTVPVVHFYGRRELGHILATARPKVLVTCEQFGRMSFDPELCADVPIVGLVGRTGEREYPGHIHDLEELAAVEPMPGTLPADPSGPALIAFTSGTTKQPKGVIHSHQTLAFETRQLLANYPPGRGRQLTATPIGHFIGMLGAFLIPVLEGAPVDLCDVWDPGKVLDLIEHEGLSIGGGPPYFVTSLMDHPRFDERHLAKFSTVGLGGSTVPAAVTRGWPTWDCSCSGPTAAPSIPRSPDRVRMPRRASGSTPTATSARAWRSGWGPTARSTAAARICASATPTTN
jgi:acyl-coenzyme A synthetase/AMP-(fatty) acid ligase